MSNHRIASWSACMLAVLAWPVMAPADTVSLADWLQSDAGPFFANSLATKPRFRGERIELAAMRGDQVITAVDGLSMQIQARLADQLLNAPGVRLAWRGQHPDAFIMPTAGGYDCLANADVSYLLGVDVEALPANRHRVSLRIYDKAERSFVSGAVRQWVGRLDPAARRAYEDPDTVSALAGTRQRPFRPGEPDRLASALARDLVCQLQRRRAGDVKVFVPASGTTSGMPDPALVGHYLATQREVRIVDSRDVADLILEIEAHEIAADLAQVWARLVPADAEDEVPGASAGLYRRIESSPTVVADRTPLAAPAEAAPQSRVVALPGSTVRDTAGEALLSHPRVVVPRHPALCRTANPWRHGALPAPGGGDVAAAGCFALEVDAQQDAHLFVVARLFDGSLVRLAPQGCGTHGNAAVRGSGTLTFPRGGPSAALPVADDNRVMTLILLAAADAGQPALLAEQVRRLPSVCMPHGADAWFADRWIEQTEAVMATLGDSADWQALNVRHGH